MRSRTIREGSVGLLILLGLGLFGGLILWIRGLDLGKRSYRVVIDFADASGMQVGSAVRYRGVSVGKIREVRPSTGSAQVEVEISSAALLIPRDALIQSNQAGLIGETTVDITPTTELPGAIATNPLAENCRGSAIICNGDRLQGIVGVNFNELIGATIKLTSLFADPELFQNIRSLTKNSSDAAAGVANLTGRVSGLTQSVEGELRILSNSANRTTAAVGQTAAQFGQTAAQVNSLLYSNRSSLNATLTNLSLTSNELRRVAGSLAPVLEQGEFLSNLETLSANAAEASANLRNLSQGLGSSENLLLLQETLDSARATFQNAQKITADLDELTGDPRFRQNIRNLVNGLSNLMSSTQQLQQEASIARMLAPVELAQSAPDPLPAAPMGASPAIAPSLPEASGVIPHLQPQLHPSPSATAVPPLPVLSSKQEQSRNSKSPNKQ